MRRGQLVDSQWEGWLSVFCSGALVVSLTSSFVGLLVPFLVVCSAGETCLA